MAFSKKAQKEIDRLKVIIEVLEDEKLDLNIRNTYNLLDVEATRRELVYLKKILESEE